MANGPIPNIIEDVNTRPREYQELVHAGSGTPGFLTFQWDPITNDIIVTGMVVAHNPPHAPAP